MIDVPPIHSASFCPTTKSVFTRAICGLAVLLLLAISGRADPAMWVIKDKDSTIYLIGTVHLLRHETEWNSAKVKKAITDSSELWLEISDSDNQAGVMPLIQRYGYDKEKSLSSKLTTAQKDKLAKLATEYNIPLSNVEPMKPWMAALIFAVLPLQKAGYDPNAGVDLFLKTEAEKKGEKIRGFETLEEQTRFFADLPEKDQIAFLEETLDDAKEGISKLDKLANAWIAGDSKTIGDMLVEEMKKEAPGLYQKFVVQRNIRWSEKIKEILSGAGVQLIAVGAGHLAGPESVQEELAKRGVKVEPY